MAIQRARKMRREPTEAEAVMWRLLKEQFGGWRFRRQVPLAYAICDFASHQARLVVEIDGGQHGGKDDARRDAMIAREGYRVLRFWNNEVLGNRAGVALVVARELGAISPPSNLR
nr:DUF559 domain-containing protein [Novosphingobium sp. ERW19]